MLTDRDSYHERDHRSLLGSESDVHRAICEDYDKEGFFYQVTQLGNFHRGTIHGVYHGGEQACVQELLV
jgi:hypothetical protein